MDNAKVVELAKQAGLQLNVYADAYPVIAEQLGRFAELVAAAERERLYNEVLARGIRAIEVGTLIRADISEAIRSREG